MKIALAFVLLFAVARGLPQPSLAVEPVTPEERSLVVEVILDVLETVRTHLLENGFDPLSEDRIDVDTTGLGWIIDGIISANQVSSTGLGSFVINRMNFATLTSRLTFDLSIPQLTFGIGAGSFSGKFSGYDTDVFGGGSIAVFNPRVWGQVRVSVGIITGISIRDLQINFNLDSAQSQINNLIYNGEDVTNDANDLIGNIIPTFINENQALVTEFLSNFVQEIIDGVLQQ